MGEPGSQEQTRNHTLLAVKCTKQLSAQTHSLNTAIHCFLSMLFIQIEYNGVICLNIMVSEHKAEARTVYLEFEQWLLYDDEVDVQTLVHSLQNQWGESHQLPNTTLVLQMHTVGASI